MRRLCIPSDLGIDADDPVLRAFRADIYNAYASAKAEYLYAKLSRMGPWHAEDFTMEFFLELDALHSAIVMAYGRVFSGGVRRVSERKVPGHLRSVHDQMMALRQQRYGHNGEHDTLRAELELEVQGNEILVHPRMVMGMALGAPPEWKPLLRWLNEYCHEQVQSHLSALSRKTGKTWVYPEGPPPDWVEGDA